MTHVTPAGSTMTIVGNDNSFVASVIALGNIGPTTITVNHDPYDVRDLSAYHPYRGLESFGYADSALYAGREPELDRALKQLVTPGEAQSVLFVTGISGSGKSSFVHAGILPRLEAYYQTKERQVRIWSMRPSKYPLAQFHDAFERFGLPIPDSPAPAAWHTAMMATPATQLNILVLDQAEELFTQTATPDERNQVLDLIAAWPSLNQGRTYLLVTIRADYLPDLLQTSTAVYEHAMSGLALGVMDETALRAAIQRPLQWFQEHVPAIRHKAFDPDLLEQLIHDATEFRDHDPDTRAAYLPLLQVTLEDLWNRGSLRRGAYRSLTTAIQTWAHTCYERTTTAKGVKRNRTAEEKKALEAMLLELVDPSLDNNRRRDVRRRRTVEELATTPDRQVILQELASARIISVDVEIRAGQAVQVVDLIHESLIHNWDDLAAAIERHRSDLHRRKRFEDAVEEWIAYDRDEQYLLPAIRLAEATTLLQREDIAVRNDVARDFLIASTLAHDADQQAQLVAATTMADMHLQRAEAQTRLIRSTRRFATVVVGLLLIALITAGLALNRQSAATQEAQGRATTQAELETQLKLSSTTQAELETQLEVSSTAQAQLQAQQDQIEDQIDRSESQLLASFAKDLPREEAELRLLVAIEAVKRDANFLSRSTLYAAYREMPFQLAWCEPLDFLQDTYYSADGSTVMMVDRLIGTIRILNQFGQLEATVTTHREIRWLTMSPDGNFLLIQHDLIDSLPELWSRNGQLIGRLSDADATILSGVFYPDGLQLLTVMDDGSVRVWDTQARLVGRVFESYPLITTIVVDQTGTRILTINAANETALWNAAYERIIPQLEPPRPEPFPNPTVVVDPLIALPSLQSSLPPLHAAFSPNGKSFLTLTSPISGGIVRLQSAVNGGPLNARLEGLTVVPDYSDLEQYENPIRAAWYSGDGSRIVTLAEGNYVVLWTSEGAMLNVLPASPNQIVDVAINAQGNRIATTALNGTVTLWDDQGQVVGDIETVVEDVSMLEFHPITAQMLVQSDNDVCQIKHPSSEEPFVSQINRRIAAASKVPTTPDALVFSGLSPDGNHLITRSRDGQVGIWDLDGVVGTPLTASAISSVYIYPERLLTISMDGSTIALWDMMGQRMVQIANDPQRIFRTAQLSRDAQSILTTSFDGTVVLWALDGSQRATFNTDNESVGEAFFSVDGQRIVTVSTSMDVRLWDAQGTLLNSMDLPITKLTVSPDTSQLVAWSSDSAAILDWEGNTTTLDVDESGVQQVVFSPDGTLVLTVGMNHEVQVWTNQGQSAATLTGHRDTIREAVFSLDGSIIITTSGDGTIRIWDRSGQPRSVIQESAQQAIVTSDSSRIITITTDGRIAMIPLGTTDLLSLAQCAVTRRLTPQEYTQLGIEPQASSDPPTPDCPPQLSWQR